MQRSCGASDRRRCLIGCSGAHRSKRSACVETAHARKAPNGRYMSVLGVQRLPREQSDGRRKRRMRRFEPRGLAVAVKRLPKLRDLVG